MATKFEFPVFVANDRFFAALRELRETRLLICCIDFDAVLHDVNALELESCSSCVQKVKLLQAMSMLGPDDGDRVINYMLRFFSQSYCTKFQPQALINVDLGIEKALGNFTTTFTQSMRDCFNGIANSANEAKSAIGNVWEKLKPFMCGGFGLVAFLVVFATIKISITIVRDVIGIVKFLAKMILPAPVHDFVFEKQENEIVEQSGVNWHGYIFRLVVALFSGFSINLAKRFFQDNLAIRCCSDILSFLPNFIDDVLAYFKLPFTFNTHIPKVIVELIKRLLNASKKMKRVDLNKGFKPQEIVEFFSIVRDYESCRERFTTHKAVSDYLHNFTQEYRILLDFTLSLKQSEDRMEPIVVYLVGEPGCGKSSMYTTLTQIITGVCYNTTQHQASKWTYTEGMKHFDGYKNQEIVVVDDAFQSKDSEASPNTLVGDLIRMVNTSSFNLPMAHLDNKGTTYFTSDFILATSNTRLLGPNIIKSINTIDALIRRLSFPFEIRLIKSLPRGMTVFAYIAQQESTWDENDVDYTTKAMALRDSLWKFRRLNLKTGRPEGDEYVFTEFVEIILSEYRRKKENVRLTKRNAIKDFSRWSHLQEQSGFDIKSSINKYFSKTKDYLKSSSIPENLQHLRSILKKYLDFEDDIDEVLTHFFLILSRESCGTNFASNMDDFDYLLCDGNTTAHREMYDEIYAKEIQPFRDSVDKYDYNFMKVPPGVNVGELGITLMNLIYDDFSKFEKHTQYEMRKCFEERSEYNFGTILRNHIKPITVALTILIGGLALCKMLKKMGSRKSDKILVEKKDDLASEIKDKMVELKCQGSNLSCESLISFMTSKLRKNTIRFTIVTKEGDSEYEQYLGYAILPKTNVMIFPFHFLKLAAKHDAFKIRCFYISLNPLEEDKKAFEITKAEFNTWKQYHRRFGEQLLPTDLVIVNVITAGVKDITDQFFPASELSKSYNSLSSSNSMHLVVKPLGQHYGVQFRSVGNFNSYVDSFAYGDPNVKYSHLVMYNMPTSYGDCGGCVIVNTKSDGFKIIGCHTAGDTTSRALCAIITSDDIKSFDDNFRNFTTPISVAQQSGLIRKQNNFLNAKSSISRYPPDITPQLDYTVQKFPSVLSVWIDKEGNKRSPIKEAQARYQECPANYSLNVKQEQFFYDVCEKIVPLSSSHRIYDRVWTFQEAVLGKPGISYFDSLNRSTSAGLKYSKISPNGKFGFFGNDEIFNLNNNNCAILEKDVNTIIESARKSVRLEHIFKDCLKDELLTKNKIDMGKTRLFNTGPLDYQIAYKMYCGAFIKMIKDKMFRIGISIGINPYSDWDLLYKKLTSRFDNAFAGDFTGWDMRLTPQFFVGVLEIMNKWYQINGGTSEDDEIRRVLFAEVYNSLHQGIDGVYYWYGGNSSGHAGTAMNNSLYNLLLFSYCARELTGKSLYEIADFAIYGDDNLFVTNEKDFNLQNCSLLLDRFGMIYGTDTKDGTIYNFKPISECSFLKRKFVHSNGDTLAPLDIHSVLTCLFYKKTKDESEDERLMKYFRQCCELSLHTKDVFEKYFNPIWDIVRHFSWVKLKHPKLYLISDRQQYLQDLARGFEYY